MAATPLSGQIAASDLYELNSDAVVGFVSEPNLSIRTVATIVRAYGQPSPSLSSTTNIKFSDFYATTIMSVYVQSTPESASTYADSNNGTITVTTQDIKFGSLGTSVTVTLDGVASQTINISGAIADVFTFTGLNSGAYTLSIRDNVTGKSQAFSISVQYAGVNEVVTKNW